MRIQISLAPGAVNRFGKDEVGLFSEYSVEGVWKALMTLLSLVFCQSCDLSVFLFGTESLCSVLPFCAWSSVQHVALTSVSDSLWSSASMSTQPSPLDNAQHCGQVSRYRRMSP